MNRLIVVILFAVFLFLQFGCSGGNTDVSNASEANSPRDPYAEITDANEALALGNKLLEDNETEKAIDAFFRATELDPNLAEAYFKLGIAYALVEKEQQLLAGGDVNIVIPGDANAAKRERTNSEKAFRKAVEAYKKILAANPNDDVANYNLGRSYNKLNEDEDAAKALRQAVKLKPEDVEYQTELGAILIKLAQYREAIGPLKKAIEIDPENSRATDLLDDAEAGRNRIDYVPPKKGDSNSSNSNANVNANSSSNIDQRPTPDNKKPEKTEAKDKRPNPPANKPN